MKPTDEAYALAREIHDDRRLLADDMCGLHDGAHGVGSLECTAMKLDAFASRATPAATGGEVEEVARVIHLAWCWSEKADDYATPRDVAAARAVLAHLAERGWGKPVVFDEATERSMFDRWALELLSSSMRPFNTVSAWKAWKRRATLYTAPEKGQGAP